MADRSGFHEHQLMHERCYHYHRGRVRCSGHTISFSFDGRDHSQPPAGSGYPLHHRAKRGAGTAGGVFSVFGISTGSLVHTTAAAFGLSAILANSATAFGLIRWLGAAYLVYLGIQIFFQTDHDPSVAPTGEEGGANL